MQKEIAARAGLKKKKKYYFNKKDGAALTGKQKIGKNFYIFSNKGVLQKNKEVMISRMRPMLLRQMEN